MSIHEFRNGHQGRLTATTWAQRIDEAHTVEDVLAVSRDFLAVLSPYDLANLPEDCRPPAKLFDEDVCAYAYELVRYETTTADTQELVHKLARFFSHACSRLAQVQGHAHISRANSARSA